MKKAARKTRPSVLWCLRLPDSYMRFLFECYPADTLRGAISLFLVERKRRIVPKNANPRVLHGKTARQAVRLGMADWKRVEALSEEFGELPSEALKSAIRQKAERAGYLLEVEKTKAIWTS